MTIISRSCIWIFIVIFTKGEVIQAQCGGYFVILPGQSGQLSSPNYPNKYAIMDKCIWMYETQDLYSFALNIFGVAGDVAKDGTCKDYIEVREGSSTAMTLLNPTCNVSSVIRVESVGKYMWIKFYSDYSQVNTGFFANFTIFKSGRATPTNLTRSCHLTAFSCPNLECIETPYICDAVNDCGCDGNMCDESDHFCKLSYLSKSNYYGISIGIGCGIFFFVFLVYGFWDSSDPELRKCCRDCGHRCAVRCSCHRPDKDKAAPVEAAEEQLKRMIAIILGEGGSEYTSSRSASRRMSVYTVSRRQSIFTASSPFLTDRRASNAGLYSRDNRLSTTSSFERKISTGSSGAGDVHVLQVPSPGSTQRERKTGIWTMPDRERALSSSSSQDREPKLSSTSEAPERKISAYGTTLFPTDLPPEMRRDNISHNV